MRSWGHQIPVCVANPPWRAVLVCDGEGLGGVHRKQGRGGCWAARLHKEMACMRVRLRIAWTALLNTMCKARHQAPPAVMSAALLLNPAYLPRTGSICRCRCGSGGVWDGTEGSTCQCGSGLPKGGRRRGSAGCSAAVVETEATHSKLASHAFWPLPPLPGLGPGLRRCRSLLDRQLTQEGLAGGGAVLARLRHAAAAQRVLGIV